jgi:hypothetical protein
VSVDYGENTRALIEAGVIPGPPPAPYDQLVEDLSSAEVEALISIKSRIEKANVDAGCSRDAGFFGFVIPL